VPKWYFTFTALTLLVLFKGQHDTSSSTPPALASFLSGLGLDFLTPSYTSDAHLLGQHIVRMSPISTAQLNPEGQTFCLADASSSVLIPVLLNNTTPTTLRYSLTPLGSGGRAESYDLSSRDLKLIEAARLEGLALTRASPTPSADDYEDYDDDEDDDEQTSSSTLQKTQSLAHIRLTKPGVLRLERIIHSSSVDARVVYSTALTVAPCPRASFVDDPVLTQGKSIRCAGADPDLDLAIDIHGVPPLSLRWSKEVNGHQESFTVEGIEAGHRTHGHGSKEVTDQHKEAGNKGSEVERGIPQSLQVPLTVAVDTIGTHVYTLESVTDGLGNLVHLTSQSSALSLADVSTSSKTRRLLRVLKRASTAFKGCGPGSPAALPIGGDATLTISTKDSDEVDAPWEITLQYQPAIQEDGRVNPKLKPWTKVITADAEHKDAHFRARTPGDYIITSVRGKQCEGDVLSPDVCKVVEMPYPTAEIEWKRIHEW
jgi:nucleoporin POM152